MIFSRGLKISGWKRWCPKDLVRAPAAPVLTHSLRHEKPPTEIVLKKIAPMISINCQFVSLIIFIFRLAFWINITSNISKANSSCDLTILILPRYHSYITKAILGGGQKCQFLLTFRSMFTLTYGTFTLL